MTTELYEVYSLEEGDQIVINEDIYFIRNIETLDRNSSSLRLIDESGYGSILNLEDTAKVRVICDVYHTDKT